jgi:hypothetical protein
MANYNWSPELQTLVDLLNTPISQAPPTPTSSAMPRHSIVGPVPRQHHALGLSFNYLQLNRSILPHTSIHCIHTLHLQSVVHRVEMLLHRIHTLDLQSVVHRMKMFLHRIHNIHLRSVVPRMEMLLHRIHIIHLHHIATHHIHTLLPQPVVCQVVLFLNHIHILHL